MAMAKKWRWLRGTAVGLLIAILLAVLLIGLGVFDPKPVGTQRWQQALTAQTIGPQSRQVQWLASLPTGDFSLQLTAAYAEGEKDSVYGLLLDGDGGEWGTAVSPLGYVTMWQGDEAILPLQPWPHVQVGTAVNEIWLDNANGRMTVRLNREILWQGDGVVATRVGIMGESFGETAVFDFLTLTLFAPDATEH